MRVSLSWIQDLLQIKSSPDEISDRLSMAGFEVEELVKLSDQAEGVVAGFVEALVAHPNSEKLKICEVNVGLTKPIQIICGANNIKAGIHVCVALEGVFLPSIKLKIKSTKLRGIESNGMICSKAELGIEQSSEGIIILEEITNEIINIGSPVIELLGLNETIFDIAITANRPDGMSVVGISTELSALYSSEITLPKNEDILFTKKSNINLEEYLDHDGVFSITLIEQIDCKNIILDQIIKRLKISNIKSINPIVDVTNYVMIEQGQPLHAYDADKLEQLIGREVTPDDFSIRKSQQGEKFITLDGTELTTTPNNIIISCNNIPISLAGIVGSNSCSVNKDTKRIWLEAANFKPSIIRSSSKTIGIRTESSSRFEKGIPGNVTFESLKRTVFLFKNLFNVKSVDGFFYGVLEFEPKPINLRIEKIRQTLGNLKISYNSNKEDSFSNSDNLEFSINEISSKLIESKLSQIGCKLTIQENGWQVIIPKFRNKDLTREIDLIEEIARLIGYDNFNSFLPDPIRPGGLNHYQQKERDLSNLMVTVGFQEVTTLSLVPKGSNNNKRIPLSNPLMKETSYLRNNLLNEHLNITERNLKNGQKGLWIFESGYVYSYNQNKEIRTNNLISGIITGERKLENWFKMDYKPQINYYKARGILTKVFNFLKLSVEDRPQSENDLYHPGRSANLYVEGKKFGTFGQIHPEKISNRDVPRDSYIFEFDFDLILLVATRPNKLIVPFKEYSTFPSMERDISMYVSNKINSNEISSVINKSGRKLLQSVTLIDRFEDPQKEDETSFTYRLCYRKTNSTLTEEEIRPIHEKIIKTLEERINAKVRK